MLAEVLGLYSTCHPKSKYRCTHCLVQSAQLHDWSIEEWPMRLIEEMKRLGVLADSKETDNARKTFASNNTGVRVSSNEYKSRKMTYILQSTPALSIPLSRCPPCYLHMVMALVRLLWNQLVFLAEMVPEAAEELINFLKNILGMTLPP